MGNTNDTLLPINCFYNACWMVHNRTKHILPFAQLSKNLLIHWKHRKLLSFNGIYLSEINGYIRVKYSNDKLEWPKDFQIVKYFWYFITDKNKCTIYIMIWNVFLLGLSFLFSEWLQIHSRTFACKIPLHEMNWSSPWNPLYPPFIEYTTNNVG